MNVQLRRNQRGQALLELALAIALVGIFALAAIPYLHDALNDHSRAHEQTQILLAQAGFRADRDLEPDTLGRINERYGYPDWQVPEIELLEGGNYAFASVVGPVWSILAHQRDFSLPVNNLQRLRVYHTQDDEQFDWFHYVRLDNDWSPRRVGQLDQRPRALTLTSYLNNLGVEYLQQWIGLLPFAEEFRPSQLILGHVDNQVVPSSRLCREPCDDN